MQSIADCFSEVRVCLNWQRFFDENWPVYSVRIGSLKALQDLYVPWYVGDGEFDIGFNAPNAQPVRVGQVVDHLGDWPANRRKGIMRYAASYKANIVSPLCLALPGFYLGNNENLLLDGNHRAVALALCGVGFELTLHSVHGPRENTALPDLVHWRA